MGSITNNNTELISFSLCSFNANGFKSNSSYISYLVQNYDVIFICEHWLSKAEIFLGNDMFKSTHNLYFQEANKQAQGRPYGGNCFLVRKKIFNAVNIIFQNDNLFALKLQNKSQTLFIIGVYLPASRNNPESIEEYKII